VTIHSTDEDDTPNLWTNDIGISIMQPNTPTHVDQWEEGDNLPFPPSPKTPTPEGKDEEEREVEGIVSEERLGDDEEEAEEHKEKEASEDSERSEAPTAPKDFEKGPWMDPGNVEYGRGMRRALLTEIAALARGTLDLETTESAFVVLAEDEPPSYKDAINSNERDMWRKACEDEIDLLGGYRTWTLVNPPKDKNVVGSRWTFRVKRDNVGRVNRYKARLVARGFSQIPGVDFNETYSPTIRLTSIRMILALASKFNLELRQVDVKGAYLNGKLEEEVYMQQPEGFVKKQNEHMVCKLNKGIYGLKQSGRVWHHTLRHEMEKLGFTTGTADTTIFFRFTKGGGIEIVGWYVDDGLLASNSTKGMDSMLSDIRGSFDIQDLGNPTRLLGIKIDRSRELGTIHISQPAFITTIAKRFDVTPGRTVSSPMDNNTNFRMATDDEEAINIPYASLIGSINYCAVSTRPDIAYATNKCAQFASKPTLAHWEAAKRIVRYLLHTKEYGILYKMSGGGIEGYAHNMAGYVDADFAGDLNDRKSTTGWTFMFNGAPISWASKKQNHVARSTMESELVAGSFASAEGIWIIKLGKDFKLNFTPIPIYTDNQSAIIFSNNEINNNKTKHIDIHFHYTRNQIETGNIKLHYINTSNNPADILTKPLSPRKHIHLLDILGVCRV